MAEYDAIGELYSEVKTAPFRVHLEAYTVERWAGDVRGARVLDLACGDGFYSRRFMAAGAAETLGVDASAEMVALGRRVEAAAPRGCRYLHADVSALGVIGEFDLVVAAYLLNYARTRAELRRFADVMYANLRPGGRLVGVNEYNDDGVTGTRDFARHGFLKIGPSPYVEGAEVTCEFLLGEGRNFSITNYYWRPETYLEILAAAGFRNPAWHLFEVSPQGRSSFPPGYWDDLLSPPPMKVFVAER